MRNAWLMLVVALTAGCAGTVKTVPAIVEVPVHQACVTALPPAPDYETQYLPADADLCAIADALLIERRQRMIYTEQLTAALAGCMPEGSL